LLGKSKNSGHEVVLISSVGFKGLAGELKSGGLPVHATQCKIYRPANPLGTFWWKGRFVKVRPGDFNLTRPGDFTAPTPLQSPYARV
jgi:hypothetical protein